MEQDFYCEEDYINFNNPELSYILKDNSLKKVALEIEIKNNIFKQIKDELKNLTKEEKIKLIDDKKELTNKIIYNLKTEVSTNYFSSLKLFENIIFSLNKYEMLDAIALVLRDIAELSRAQAIDEDEIEEEPEQLYAYQEETLQNLISSAEKLSEIEKISPKNIELEYLKYHKALKDKKVPIFLIIKNDINTLVEDSLQNIDIEAKDYIDSYIRKKEELEQEEKSKVLSKVIESTFPKDIILDN